MKIFKIFNIFFLIWVKTLFRQINAKTTTNITKLQTVVPSFNAGNEIINTDTTGYVLKLFNLFYKV